MSNSINVLETRRTVNRHIRDNPTFTIEQDLGWLREPTEAVCKACGAEGMPRWCALNQVCEECFQKDEVRICFEEKVEDPLSAMGIPVRYRTYTEASYVKAWGKLLPEQLRHWATSPYDLITITGEAGAGKTWAATAALRLAEANGKWCQWTDANEALTQIREDHRYGHSKLLDRLRKCVALVVDDLGMERQTDYATDLFQQLLRHRYSDGKGTVITTNIPVAQWELENPALARRLFEDVPLEM